MDIVKSVEHEQLKNKIPDLKVGDTVRVHQKIKEGNRQRIQVFEGIIIKKQNGGVNASFTVRKISSGVGEKGLSLSGMPPCSHKQEHKCRISLFLQTFIC